MTSEGWVTWVGVVGGIPVHFSFGHTLQRLCTVVLYANLELAFRVLAGIAGGGEGMGRGELLAVGV